jgi:hypothetical protein
VTDRYTSAPLRRTGDAGVLVIHCSDPRYQPHFQDFLRNGLGLDHYGLVAIPGGVQTLTLVTYLPKFAWSGWRWLKFMFRLMTPARVVLIAHDDCRWYFDNRFLEHEHKARGQLVDDLQRVRQDLVERFGDTRVEMYYATLDGERAAFDAVP